MLTTSQGTNLVHVLMNYLTNRYFSTYPGCPVTNGQEVLGEEWVTLKNESDSWKLSLD